MCVRAVGGSLGDGDENFTLVARLCGISGAVNHLLHLRHAHGLYLARHGGAVSLPARPASALVRKKNKKRNIVVVLNQGVRTHEGLKIILI